MSLTTEPAETDRLSTRLRTGTRASPRPRRAVFEGVSPRALRTRYRELLDAVSWPPADEDAFLAEVSEAYRRNIAVRQELKEQWS
jgi:hypothetical protein